jgi:hypothetical protein
MQKHMNRTHFFALSLLLLLPGCKFNPLSWFRGGDSCCDGKDSSTVLLRVNGKAVITEDSLNKEIQNIIAKNPQYAQFMSINEAHFKKLVFDEKKAFILAEEWIKRNKMHESPDFIEALKQAKQHISIGMCQKHVLDNITITDEEATEFYNKNDYKTHFKAEYAELDEQKKEAVKNMIKQQEKFKAALEAIFAQIEKDAKVEVNEDFFKEKPAAEAAATEASAQTEAPAAAEAPVKAA